MKKYFHKWTMCKKQPNLEEYTLEDTEIHYLGYKVVIIDSYDKGRWSLDGSAVKCITEYTKEEWNALQENKNNILRLRNNAQDNC